MKFLTTLLLIFGITLFSIGLYLLWDHYNPNQLAFTNYQYTQDETRRMKDDNFPTHVAIPDIEVNLQVIPANVKGSTWETTNKGASYLQSSPVPGSDGNSILYAHNKSSLFGRLPLVKPGNVVEVTFADNTTKTFAVAYTLEVSPGDSSILQNNEDTRITLYTCTGFLDSKRFVAVAFPQ